MASKNRAVKSFLFWLMGRRAGLTITAIWNWLWGLPIESGRKIVVEVAQESLHSMQQSVQKLTESVATLVAAIKKHERYTNSSSRSYIRQS
jgi:phage shock protein A